MKTKRILSALLAFAMLLSACPDVMFGHVHAADTTTTSGDPIDINGVTLGSSSSLYYFKYIVGAGSGKDTTYTLPIDWKSTNKPAKGDRTQMIVPADFQDYTKGANGPNPAFSTQKGNYITRFEFVLNGHYHSNVGGTGSTYDGAKGSANHNKLLELAAEMKQNIKLGDITLKLGTTDNATFTGNGDYITEGLTEVNVSDLYITPYVHAGDTYGGNSNGGDNDYFDILVIELETPYYYDGTNIVVDIELGDGWDTSNVKSRITSGDL